MSSNKPSVLIVGPGFIGWNVLDLLVAEGNYSITGFVRRKEHGEALKNSGASSIVYGDLNDKDKITAQTVNHEIIFHTATADHLPSVEAILDGIKQRAEQGQMTTFIHTSGTSVLSDWAENGNNVENDAIYKDTDKKSIDALPDDAPHRQIDLAIVNAQKELGAKAKLAIMIPPLIYGFNPKHGRLTIQIPTLTRFALKHGFVPYLGEGKGVESNIHVVDLAKAYVVLLHHMEGKKAEELLENPYWFCETTGDGEPSWKEVAQTIAEGLATSGKIQNKEARRVDEAQWGDLFGEFSGAVLGLNSRSRAVRLRELGWEPKEKDWKISYIEDELPEILKEETGSFEGYKGTVAS